MVWLPGTLGWVRGTLRRVPGRPKEPTVPRSFSRRGCRCAWGWCGCRGTLGARA